MGTAQRLKRAEADVEALHARCAREIRCVVEPVVAKSRASRVAATRAGADVERLLLARFRALEVEEDMPRHTNDAAWSVAERTATGESRRAGRMIAFSGAALHRGRCRRRASDPTRPSGVRVRHGGASRRGAQGAGAAVMARVLVVRGD